MRVFRIMIASAAGAALALLGLPTSAQADPPAPPSFTVHDAQSVEYFEDCTDEPPSDCTLQTSTSMAVGVTVNNRPKSRGQFFAITVTYEIIEATATEGEDYTGTTGSVIISPNNQNTNISVPLTNDGRGEDDETFTVRITSTSVPGDISDTGTATIVDGSQFPVDCSLSQDLGADERSLTCTNRPAGQQWLLQQPFASIGGIDFNFGNTVTGNGTSTADLVAFPLTPSMFILS